MNLIQTVFLSAVLALFGQPVSQLADDQQHHAVQVPAYEIVKGPYPAEVTEAMKQLRPSGGDRLVRADGKFYLVISLGQRPTGGYSLQLQKMDQLANGEWQITVAEQKPQPGMMTTQVITYPTLVIALPDNGQQPVYHVIAQ
ncbi:protease complex subunit PrcB family protein [Brevibacillus fulvus]|uniref:PrcB C-terminal domain-containing protein n=1 Tax=Brevibacillus fulvus TaxID=1125967 RepID=A0A939BTK2_9BACL|nr:protease complex subunit PrcB family protein [Brevibacillus fulvus]MBM7588541.1 hypothetical protein [Brevibacillus fulvus]